MSIIGYNMYPVDTVTPIAIPFYAPLSMSSLPRPSACIENPHVNYCHLLNRNGRIPSSFQQRSTRVEILVTRKRPVHLTHGMWIAWDFTGQSNSKRTKNMTLKGYFLVVNVKSWFQSHGELKKFLQISFYPWVLCVSRFYFGGSLLPMKHYFIF